MNEIELLKDLFIVFAALGYTALIWNLWRHR